MSWCRLSAGLRIFFAIAMCANVTGCKNYRITVAVNVADKGREIVTKYRYKLVVKDQVGRTLDCSELNSRMLSAFPKVFANDGILVEYDYVSNSNNNSGFWSALLFGPTIGTLPTWFVREHRAEVELVISDAPEARLDFAHIRREDEAFSTWTPLPLLFWQGEATSLGNNGEFDKSRKFSSRTIKFGTTVLSKSGDNILPVYDDAAIYGIAATLKRMEDEGIVNDAVVAKVAGLRAERMRQELARKGAATKKRQTETVVRPDVPSYRAISCRRVQGSDFAFEFEVEITSSNLDPMKAFTLIQYRYADVIKNLYMNSHPNADAANIAVDFPQYELRNGRILGQAVVIAITPVSLSYDPSTRRGVVSVRFGAGQYEEARAWAKKNIETLVRDKNIALETGSLPPQARYYSLGETLKDGNILEIEFRTE